MEMMIRFVLMTAIIVDAVMLCFYLIRAVKGPTTADRLVAINMIGTVVIIMIALLSYYFDADYLVDICIVYAMINFLATIVLSKVYIGAYTEKKEKEQMKEEK